MPTSNYILDSLITGVLDEYDLDFATVGRLRRMLRLENVREGDNVSLYVFDDGTVDLDEGIRVDRHFGITLTKDNDGIG